MRGPRGAALLLALLLACTACGPGTLPPPSGSPGTSAAAPGEQPADGQSAGEQPAAEQPAGFTYTNLASEAAVGAVRAALVEAGVPPEAADQVMDWAADYNDCMKDCSAFTLMGDPAAAPGPVVDYGDYPAMSREWYKKNGRDYHDLLCRVVAFQLDRQNIAVERPIPREAFDCWDSETAWLYTDGDILFGREAVEGEHRAYRPYPLLRWDEDTVADYFTLFDPVPVAGEPDEEAMLAAVRARWQERGVTFREGGCSLVTLWTVSGGRLAAAHAALLAETADGLLLFEKTNPESPYSAAWFSSAAGAGQYLYEMLVLDYRRYGMEPGPCLLLRNDQPL